jgi:hypothetical protein
MSKNSHSLRFCIDYRCLNAMTTKDLYPMPRMENCLRYVGNAQFLRNPDLDQDMGRRKSCRKTGTKIAL